MKKIVKINLTLLIIVLTLLCVTSCDLPVLDNKEEKEDELEMTLDVEMTEEKAKIINVYLIGGQSNAVGYGMDTNKEIEASDTRFITGFDNVIYYGALERWDNKTLSDKFRPVQIGMGVNSNRCGAEIGIASALGDGNEMNAVIKCAWGATHLYPDNNYAISYNQGTWTPPSYIEKHNINLNANNMIGRMYRWFEETVTDGLELLINQGYTPVIKGMWWMQGEAEMFSTEMSSPYEELLRTLISDIRTTVSNITGCDYSEMPFVFGLPKWNENNSAKPAYQDAVRNAMTKVANDVNVLNAAYVDCMGLNQHDDWHFDAMGQKSLGEQFIAKLATLNEGKNAQLSETVSLSNDVTPIENGMEFTATIANYDTSNENEYGILVVPTADLLESNITENYIENLDDNEIEYLECSSTVEEPGKGNNQLYVKGILENVDSSVDYTAIAYIIDSNGQYFYSNPISKSLERLASEKFYAEGYDQDLLGEYLYDDFELKGSSELQLPYSDVKYTVKLNVTQSPNKNYYINYTSSNNAVASVDENGVITVKEKGNAVITAQCAGVEKEINVLVGDYAEKGIKFDGVIDNEEYTGNVVTANNSNISVKMQGVVRDNNAYLAFEITHGEWSKNNSTWYLNDNIEFYLNSGKQHTVIFYNGEPVYSNGISRAYSTTKTVNGQLVTTVEVCVEGVASVCQLRVGMNGDKFGWLGALWDNNYSYAYLTEQGIKVREALKVDDQLKLDGQLTESYYTNNVKNNSITVNANGANVNLMGTLIDKGVLFAMTVNHSKAPNVSTNGSADWYTFQNMEFRFDALHTFICTTQNNITSSKALMFCKTVNNGGTYTTTYEIFIPYEAIGVSNDVTSIDFTFAGWFETGWCWANGSNSWNPTHTVSSNGIVRK